MDWDDLKTFLAVSREGTLSAAARTLGVTQTTVGRRLDALHKRAGARLLQKTPEGYVLTDAGARVLANVESMEAEALAAELAVAGDDVRLDGVVRVTTVSALATRVLGPTLADFHRRYPDIVIEFDLTPRILSLTRREADIALRIGRFEQNDLVARKLGEFTMGIYASETYLAELGMPDFAAGAPGHRKLMLPSEPGSRTLFRGLERHTAHAKVVLRSNLDMLLVAAQSGLGLTVMPDHFAASAPGLVRLAAPPSPPGELWLGVHRDLARAPRIRVVLDHIAAVIHRAVTSEVETAQ